MYFQPQPLFKILKILWTGGMIWTTDIVCYSIYILHGYEAFKTIFYWFLILFSLFIRCTFSDYYVTSLILLSCNSEVAVLYCEGCYYRKVGSFHAQSETLCKAVIRLLHFVATKNKYIGLILTITTAILICPHV